MPGQGVTLYALTAGGNKAIVGTIDWREDVYLPAQINDNVAQIMADIRAMANAIGTGWLEIGDGDGVYTAVYVAANQFQFTGIDVTPYYRVGMRVRVVAPTPGTISGTIMAVAFTTNTLITVAWDSGPGLSNEAITSVSVGIGSGGSAGGQLNYRNILGRNGGFEVWQRGAGGSASFSILAGGAQYVADGWYFLCQGNQASTVSQVAGLTDGSRYGIRVARNNGQTGVGVIWLEYPLDTDEIALARNNLVTLSFTARAGANFSPAGLAVQFYIGTGAPARVTAGFTGTVQLIAGNQALSATATRYSFTTSAVVPLNATQASVAFPITPVGTAGAADYFEIDDVQLEIGSVATPFERRPFESEIAACQRHYEKTFNYAVAPAQATGVVPGALFTDKAYAAGAVGVSVWSFKVTKRVNPTITTFNPSVANANYRNGTLTADYGVTVGNIDEERLHLQTASGVMTVNDAGVIHAAADAGI